MDIDSFLELFVDDEPTYPGSRQQRRPLDPVVVERQQRAEDAYSWDAKPVLKVLNGQQVEMFTAGDLGIALGGFSVETIRLWERKGRIPKAPYRLPDVTTSSGEVQAGRRYYSRSIVEATIAEFAKRGLIGKRRIEWKNHEELTIALVARWREITGTKYA